MLTKLDWPKKIHQLRQMLEHGPLWPQSTKLAGYAAKGPYHCGMCRYFNGVEYCNHPVVLADEQVKKHQGKAVVDGAKGCCEFVEPR